MPESKIIGLRELNRKLSLLADKPRGKALRSAALSATLPALRAAQNRAPVGKPPYESGDPYPVRSYKGRLRTPGFLKRNIARKTRVSRDKNSVRVMIGPKAEAFYGTTFIELGTSSIPKRPWLEPSFRASIGAINGRFRARLKKLLDQAAK